MLAIGDFARTPPECFSLSSCTFKLRGQKGVTTLTCLSQTAPRNVLNNLRALPAKTRAMRQIAPERSLESSAKSFLSPKSWYPLVWSETKPLPFFPSLAWLVFMALALNDPYKRERISWSVRSPLEQAPL